MSDAWTSYPGAPAPGTTLCTLDAVPDGGTLAVEVDGFPVLLLRRAGGVLGFVNACPHQYLPLTHASPSVLSADGTRLICSNHDAVFDAHTGQGLGGWGQGCNLDPVPVVVSESHHVIISE